EHLRPIPRGNRRRRSAISRERDSGGHPELAHDARRLRKLDGGSPSRNLHARSAVERRRDRQSWRYPVRAALAARALCETDPPQSGEVRSLALVTRQTVLSGCSNQFLARRSLMVSEAQSLPRGDRRPIGGKLENPGQGCPWGNGAIVVREISI